MELHGVNVSLFDDGGEFRAVATGGGSWAIRILRGVRVGKIKIRLRVNACEQETLALLCELVPAHVRQLHGWQQCRNDSGQQVQTVELGGFFAGLEQNLQAQANPQKRHTSVNGVNPRRAEFLFVKSTNEGSVMPNAGEEQRLRFGNTLGRIGTVRLRAEALERALDGRHIARAIVENGHFHRSPFVLGKTWRRRLSRETAKRRARAKALKMAST